jgi:hypothetical protein
VSQSDIPTDTVQRAANAALEAVGTALNDEGAVAVRIFVTLQARDVPAGELDCCTAGEGYDDARDLLAELVGAASSVAKQLGLRLDVIPITKVGHG